MVLYGAASAALGCADSARSSTRCSRTARTCGRLRRPSSLVYLVKGIGAYLSGYLMTDVGQRVVCDLRNLLFRHILGQSAAFFCAADDRPADVADHQRRGAGAARRLRNDGRSGARVAGARRLRGAALLLRRAAGARVPDRRAARRLSAGASRPARAPHRPAQPGGAGADVARERRGDHRSSHRQGVRRRGAGGREVRARLTALLPDEHEGHERAVGAAAADGVHRRRRVRRRARVRQPGDWRAGGCRPASSRRSSRRCS